ncbi:helicase [Bifidobacterium lemurum]|uniref:Helicase n=1 Tax=Bifidobacterium lemurum TaxID=1603886 RepID=A0A261FU61_9BIFI|nr:DEAD/DEAH box helicase [Bifidobacterium lemurum]OZG62721.1 helicase [Bifidobacterium lemurum]QOL34564.1 SNF2 helicase associated domain-containing protein [Bifidobacterium lemurum]
MDGITGVFGHVPEDPFADDSDRGENRSKGSRGRSWRAVHTEGELDDLDEFGGFDDLGDAYPYGGSDDVDDADNPFANSFVPSRASRVFGSSGTRFADLTEPPDHAAVPIAALKSDMESSVSHAVLERAHGIARRSGSMLVDPSYRENRHTGYGELDAVVRGTTSPSDCYDTNVQFDLRDGEMSGGSCTCPAYHRGYGICKHMAAVVLAFSDDPRLFEGYEAGQVRPSRALLAYMEREDDREARARRARREALLARLDSASGGRASSARRDAGRAYGNHGRSSTSPRALTFESDTVAPGEVHLHPILSFIDGVWSVEFLIGAPSNGSSYVLKSIPRLVGDLRDGAYAQYGKKLAFTHTSNMFDAESRGIMRWLSTAMSARQAAERQDRYYGHIPIDRHLTLGEPEVAALLRLCEGGGVGLILDTWFHNQPSSVWVDGSQAQLALTVRRRDSRVYGDDAGYLLISAPAVETVVRGDDDDWLLLASEEPVGYAAALTLQDRRLMETRRKPASGCRFMRCPKRVRPLSALIGELFEPDGEGQPIPGDDVPLFARTLLPRLIEAGLVDEGEMPHELAELRPVECVGEFYLDRDEHGVLCEVKARYGDARISLMPAASGESVHVGRDYDAERLLLDAACEFFAMPSVAGARGGARKGHRREFGRPVPSRAREPHTAYIDRDDTTQLIRLFDEGLATLRSVGAVYTTPAFDRLLAPKPPSVKVGLSIKGNLVEISPIADEVPPDEVGSLLASYRRRQRYHQLSDGTLVNLRGARLEAMDRIADELGLDEKQLNSGLIELPGHQAFLLDGELPDDGSDAVKDAAFQEYVDDLRVIDPSRYEVPETLAAVLRPYQAEGYRWLRTLCDKGFGGILADEMGLGKSVQLIALLAARSQEKDGRDPSASLGMTETVSSGMTESVSLIVCPASLVYNWAAEFVKFAPGIDARTVAGSKAERRAAIARAFEERPRGASSVVLITSYDLLRRDVEEYTKSGRRFDVMALDEAQYIKNHTTQVAKAVKSVAADHRFALTGTPIENRLSELWSIFDFLMPGLLGSYKRFHERYELPIANGRAADASTAEGRAAAEVNPESARVARRLQSLVGVFIKRRLKSQVLTDLPDKLESVVTVRLAGEQRKLYAAHEQRLRMQLEHSDSADFNTSKIRILAELTKLRQICCDPRLLYDDAKDQSAKLAAIEELVANCMDEGKKVLVFSQFTSFLEMIAARFDAHGIRHYSITGATPKKRRLELVDRFNGDDTPAFLISLKAGNTGLNLVGASVVVHADPWWNAAAQDQATDRAHRIGQTQDVSVYQVVAEDTIEERILELQHTKSELARQFTDASSLGSDAAGVASIASLTKDDLLDLLG